MTKSNVVPIVFLAFANDRDDRARYLRNLAEEARQLKKTLSVAEQHGHCQVIVEQNVTVDVILDMFQDKRYRDRIAIFHFGGHADGYRLLLETAEGKPAAIDAGGLAQFLAQQRELQLVFLNGCSTEGQVIDLLDAGVHAVIATDQAVEDVVATAFAARFYQGLAGGAAIGTAFEQAKAAMRMQGGAFFRHLGVADKDQAGGSSIPWRLHSRIGAEAVASWSLPQAARDPLFGLPPLPPLDLPDRPYRYLDWYRREDAEVFFGRGREIRELYDRITAPASPPIVLFYGQSGVGKSSLLAAGLLPRLEGSHVVCYVRRDQANGLLGTLTAALDSAPGADLAGAWFSLEEQTGKPLLIVLDQAEELYTRPNLQQPDEMAVFMAGLESLFLDAGRRPQGKLILGFRKEWLAEIEKRLAERTLPRSKIFLERLGVEGVMEVVAGPASDQRLQAHYGLKVASKLPDTIAGDLLGDAGSSVAPMLQILLTKMWERAKARDYDHPDFDLVLYREMKREGLLLQDFLDQQLRTLHDAQPVAVESGLVLDLLAFHTTPLSTSEQRTRAELREEYRHLEAILPDLVRQSKELYLLVDPAENQPDESPSTRLTHDTLAPLVRARYDESDAPGQRARRILESRRAELEGTPERTLLYDVDLSIIEAGISGMRAWSPAEIKLVAASRQAQNRRQEEARSVQLTMETARQREMEQAQKLAQSESARSRQKTRIIRVLSSVLAVFLMVGGLRLYRSLLIRESDWKAIAGDNFPSDSYATSIAYAQLDENPSAYVYCVATWTVGVGCSRDGNTWNFYQQGFGTGGSVPGGVGGLSGNVYAIEALAIDQTNTDVLHAFASDGHLGHFYRSIDAGVTWAPNGKVLPPDTKVVSLEARNGLVVAIARNSNRTGRRIGCLYVSPDAGQTWKEETVTSDGLSGECYDVTIDPQESMIYVATSSGLFSGTLRSNHWDWHRIGRFDDTRLVERIPGDGVQRWAVVTYDKTSELSTFWIWHPSNQSDVTKWKGEPIRLTVDPNFDSNNSDTDIAYVLLDTGDVIEIRFGGDYRVLRGLKSPLIGPATDLSAVPQPSGHETWLLMAHGYGLLRHSQP